jgi:hypothetical protein
MYKDIDKRLRESIVSEMVLETRRVMPRIGGRKLYYVLKEDFRQSGKIGRDRFFEILREHDLLVKRKRSVTKTTNSYHPFHKWNNRLKGVELTGCNQT